MNTNFKVKSLTRLGIKPESTPPEADALTTRPSDLLFSLASAGGVAPQTPGREGGRPGQGVFYLEMTLIRRVTTQH